MERQPALSRRARRVLLKFADHPDVTPAHVDFLNVTLTESGLLSKQLDRSIRSGHLVALAPLPRNSHAGGCYDGDSKIISLPLHILQPESRGELIFVLGHEVQHALNSPDMVSADERFFAAAELAGQSGHDYTDAIRGYLDYERTNEASANLSGWNALADHVRNTIPDATVDHVAMTSVRSQDFVVQGAGAGMFAVRRELTLNPDLTFDLTRSNIEAMGRYYFDKDPAQTRIGFLGNSDYQNQYGSWAVSQAAACHRYYTQGDSSRPTMIINATQLGLSRNVLEENGIDLAGEPVQPYLDGSTTPPELDYLHHTILTHRYVPVDHQQHDQQRPARPAPDPSVDAARRTFAQRPNGIRGSGPVQRRQRTSSPLSPGDNASPSR